MKINDLVAEGFLDSFRKGFNQGQQDYIKRRAAQMGITPAAAAAAPAAAPTAPKTASTGYGAWGASAAAKPGPKVTSTSGKATATWGGTTTAAPAATPTAAPKAAPAAGTPVPSMQGYVYTGRIGPNGRPVVAKQKAAAPAPTPTAPQTKPSAGEPIKIGSGKNQQTIKPGDPSYERLSKAINRAPAAAPPASTGSNLKILKNSIMNLPAVEQERIINMLRKQK